MSKKKRKNSNYKAEGIETKSAADEKIPSDKLKDMIIWAVTGIILLGILIAVIVSAIPKIYYVEMDFGEYGKIVIEMNEEDAPITVNNFVKLVKRGFYDDLTIFRAQENFVIQGGRDTTANLSPIKGEFASNGVRNTISHTRGVISMARTNDPNSATSQFFITLHDNAQHSLDGSYAGFGYVIEGMDVVDAIAEKLMSYPSDSLGFVSDANAIKIISAKLIKYDKK